MSGQHLKKGEVATPRVQGLIFTIEGKNLVLSPQPGSFDGQNAALQLLEAGLAHVGLE